jgi:hypothetical protein
MPDAKHPSYPQALTRAWLEQAVIGLNLCPFAKGPYLRNRVRIVVTPASTPDDLLNTLSDELQHLAGTSPDEVETTLIVHPNVLHDFLDFNDFLDVADGLLQHLDLEGVFQIASFHPDFQFAATEPDDIGNATNQSPFPTLHLIRESSLESAIDSYGNTDAIFEANISCLKKMGPLGWDQLMQRCRAQAEQAPVPDHQAD